jgi:hypothetical protein
VRSQTRRLCYRVVSASYARGRRSCGGLIGIGNSRASGVERESGYDYGNNDDKKGRQTRASPLSF